MTSINNHTLDLINSQIISKNWEERYPERIFNSTHLDGDSSRPKMINVVKIGVLVYLFRLVSKN